MSLFRVKCLKDYDHPTSKKIYEGYYFDVLSETDNCYEIEVETEIPDDWGVIRQRCIREFYPKEVFKKLKPGVNPDCTCGAASIGYNDKGRAHSYWCILHKIED